MPRGDGTGPEAMGPMTGRGAGYCAGFGVPGYANPVGGRGFGMGFGARGGGWGRRNRYYATGRPGWARFGYQPAWDAAPPAALDREQEVEALKAQQETLGSMLENIQARLKELEDQG